MNRRDRQRRLTSDLVDAPTFAPPQPETASLFFGQVFEQPEQKSNVGLKVRERFERWQNVRIITARQERPLQAYPTRVVNHRTANYDLQPTDESRRVSQRRKALDRV